MEVNIIFQNESSIDENNSFDLEFKNEDEIIEVLFNQKRDYITNALAFIENKKNYSKAIKDLESIAEKHLAEEKKNKYKTPMSDEGGISYNPNQAIYDIGYFRNYSYYLDRSLMRLYKKTYKYINTKTNGIESFRVYNFLQHLREGITYIAYTQAKKRYPFGGIF